MPKLIGEINTFTVPSHSLVLWFLGQNGWILKSPFGFTVAVDPYLSDICNGRRPDINQARQVPIFIAPDELKVDLYACTHSHVDHACPVTIAGSYQAGTRCYLGPAEALMVFKEAGIAALYDMLFFFGVVVVGFLYLWKFDYLDWVRASTGQRKDAETEPSGLSEAARRMS